MSARQGEMPHDATIALLLRHSGFERCPLALPCANEGVQAEGNRFGL